MKTFIRILKFAKPYWFIVLLAFIASILFGLFNAMSLWVASSLIGTIMGSGEPIVESIKTSNSLPNLVGDAGWPCVLASIEIF